VSSKDPGLGARQPLVSVALCTYNGEKYIKAQLDSILKQTYEALEIIICDDRSSDTTLEILRSYEDSRIKIHENKTNLGLELNFLNAISLCQGEYISLSDQDDVWAKNKIEHLVSNIGQNTLVYADSAFMNGAGILTGVKLSEMRRMYSGGDNRVFSIPFAPFLFGHALLFTKNIKDRIVAARPPIFHDGWIGFVAAGKGTIGYLNEVLVFYRQHPASATINSRTVQTPLDTYLNTWFEFTVNYSDRNRRFFQRLQNKYNKRNNLIGAINLLFFLIRYSNVVFFAKPGLLSRLNLIRKVFRKYR